MNISPLVKFKNKLISGLNNLLYDSKSKAFLFLRFVTFLASIAAVAILIYVYGFEPSYEKIERAFKWLNILFGMFLFNFIVKFIYSFERKRFFGHNKFETFLMALIFINGLLNFLLDKHLLEDFLHIFIADNITPVYHAFISLYMFVILAVEFTKFNAFIGAAHIQPSTVFILSFVVLIVAGTGLLMLPAMTMKPEGMYWLDALFTSVSATCVTGLIVVDTATFFTFKGQVVILLLIQFGGIGIVSFASFFATFMKDGVGIKHHAMLQDFTSSESLQTARSLVRKVVLITFIIESITFSLLYFTWTEGIVFQSINDKIFFTIFHAVSAFCNAGFSLFSNNLYEPLIRDAYIFHIIIAVAVILGGIGFNTIEDLFSPIKLRERLKNPWIDWKISTKISVGVSFALILIGTIGIYFLERDNTISDKNFIEAIITSFFQSVITRTAGFNTIDFSQLMIPTLILMIFLMFIGGSSNSIAGGIKTSTLYLIIASTFATIKGKEKIEIGKRFIPKALLFKALSVFSFAVAINIIGIFVLTVSEPGISLEALAFEQVSAFGTVGLSTGITAQLSTVGKVIIIISMFLGRVGTLTFAYALSTRTTSSNYKYPSGHFMVG